MSIANPYTNPEAFGAVYVGGSRMPGILTTVTLPARQWEFNVQSGIGQTKSTIYKSLGLLETIELVHYIEPNRNGARGDYEVLRDEFLPLLIPGWPNKLNVRPKAFPLTHPWLQWLGLRRAHLTAIHAPEMMAVGDPSYTYKMVFQEDAPKLVIPTGPPEPAKINGPPAPKDALEAAVASALAQFKAL